jgi:hypothetical protein
MNTRHIDNENRNQEVKRTTVIPTRRDTAMFPGWGVRI